MCLSFSILWLAIAIRIWQKNVILPLENRSKFCSHWSVFWWVEKIAHAECKRLNILSMYESSNATQNEMWITYGNIGTKCCLSSSGLMSPLRMAVTSRAATPKGRRRMFLTFCTFASFSGGNMPPSLTTWHTRKTFSLTLDKSLLPRSYRNIGAILHIWCYMVNISQCYSAHFDWYSYN